jgi:hypothetical protein
VDKEHIELSITASTHARAHQALCLLQIGHYHYTVRRYSARLDDTEGLLRTTMDGNLVDDETGYWLLLDTPPHESKIGKSRSRKSPERRMGGTKYA